MKSSLSDYINQEQADIFQQQDAINNVSKLFIDLQAFYETIDSDLNEPIWNDVQCNTAVELSSFSSKKTETPVHTLTTIEEKEFIPKNIKPKTTTSHVVVLPNSIDEIGKIGSPSLTLHLNEPNDTFGSRFVDSHLTSNNKEKSDNYRLELLKQIEEKKRQRQLDIEREREYEIELEKKIAQQRLAMYLDYVEERKRGNFVKSKSNDHEIGAERISMDKYVLTEIEPTSNGRKTVHKPLDTNISSNVIKFDNKPKEDLSKGIKTDTNILANLSEVRKIMQHDHIEMLEKLLEMQIN